MRDHTTSSVYIVSEEPNASQSNGDDRVFSIKSRSKRSIKHRYRFLPAEITTKDGKVGVTDKICSSPGKQHYRLEDGCSKRNQDILSKSGCVNGEPVKILVKSGCKSAGTEQHKSRILCAPLTMASGSSSVVDIVCNSGKQLFKLENGCYKSKIKSVGLNGCGVDGIPIKIPVKSGCNCG